MAEDVLGGLDLLTRNGACSDLLVGQGALSLAGNVRGDCGRSVNGGSFRSQLAQTKLGNLVMRWEHLETFQVDQALFWWAGASLCRLATGQVLERQVLAPQEHQSAAFVPSFFSPFLPFIFLCSFPYFHLVL